MRTAAKIAGMGFSRMGLWGFSGGAPGLIVPKRVATLVDRWRVIAGSEDRRGCPGAHGGVVGLVGLRR